MLSTTIKEAFRELTNNLEGVMERPLVQEFVNYCSEDIDLKAEDVNDDNHHALAILSLENMMIKADELGLTDNEFFVAMIYMGMKEEMKEEMEE